ncbi:MAG: putative maltokinase, partial [Candidatus Binataceae bacterium]
IYYGDEIQMGDNVYLGDRDGVRTPMQWSGDRNAGFSSANPQQLILPVIIDHEYHYQTVNVEAQERNRHALLWWMRRLVALRKQFKAFGRGTMETLGPENPRVLAFVRSYQDERILVVANLSRFVQYVELDLSRFKGMRPVELFGRTAFPPIGDLPYLLTLGPHNFDWFSLESPRHEAAAAAPPPAEMPRFEAPGSWESFIRGEARDILAPALASYLPRCRWFRSKARTIKRAWIDDVAPIHESNGAVLSTVDVEYTYGDSETYVLPLALAEGDRSAEIRSHAPGYVIAELKLGRDGGGEGLVYDACGDPELFRALFEMIDRRRHTRGEKSELRIGLTSAYRELSGALDDHPEVRLIRAEQTNSSVVYGERLILKMVRKLEAGVSPDLEIGRFLTERVSFPHTPPLAAWLEYQSGRQEPRTLAVVSGFVANQGDAWEYTRHELERYFERVVTKKDVSIATSKRPFVQVITSEEPPAAVGDLIGAYLEIARVMGRRTAELHLALASAVDDPAFAPEPYTALYQRSSYQSMRNMTGEVFRLLRAKTDALPAEMQPPAQHLVANQDQITSRFGVFIRRKFNIVRTRCHGDLHLGQMLYTGKDFLIIDFEGEPARPLPERQRKRSPLRDVAGMLRSFHYAALVELTELLRAGRLGSNDFSAMEDWARLWHTWTSSAYLKSYLETAKQSPFIPSSSEDLVVLLDAFLLEKAIYELGYELNNRPEWVRVPIHGIEGIVGTEAAGGI